MPAAVPAVGAPAAGAPVVELAAAALSAAAPVAAVLSVATEAGAHAVALAVEAEAEEVEAEAAAASADSRHPPRHLQLHRLRLQLHRVLLRHAAGLHGAEPLQHACALGQPAPLPLPRAGQLHCAAPSRCVRPSVCACRAARAPCTLRCGP